MSSKGGGGQGEESRGVFLSAHRCPEVDMLPHHDTDTGISPRLVPADKRSELTCTSRSEANYLDVSPTCCYEGGEGEEEKEGGGISDWSEEDLFLHFSPSVILPSDDEDSGPESSFECVDVTVETQVNGQEGEGLKMVPKRQIHLKKKNDAARVINQETTDKLQLASKEGPVEVGGANIKMSACHCPHLLLRQQSCGVISGLTAGAQQGFQAGPSEGQRRLQKSFSLDETKTKMASCIIKSVLLKKMQMEQKTSHLKKRPQVLPVSPSPRERQRGREWGTGMFNAQVAAVRDVRSLVKNTCSLSLATTTPLNHKLTSFTVTGQVDAPPFTHQQAVGVKGHTTASLCKSHERKQSCPIKQQRQGSEPITSKVKIDDVLLVDLPTNASVSQSQKAAAVSHLLSLPNSTTYRPPQGTQAPHYAQVQSSTLSSNSAPSSSQVLHPGFYTPTKLHPQLWKVNYVHKPLSFIQTQVQPARPAPTLHVHTRSEYHNRSTGKSSNQTIKTCPPHGIKTKYNQEGHGVRVTATTQQQPQSQPFCCSFSPAQVFGSFLTTSHGPIFTGTAPCHVTTEPKSSRCYVDRPPQLQSKMLLDPETGQFIQVFLPADSSFLCGVDPAPTVLNPSPAVVHMASANPTPAVLQIGGANHPGMSVMQFQPAVGVSSLYAPLHLPFTLHVSTV